VKNVIPVSGSANQIEMSQMMQMMRGGGSMSGHASMGGGAFPPTSIDSGHNPGKPAEMADHATMLQNVRQLNMLVDNASQRLPELVKMVDAQGIEIASVQMHKPTLDDVFLSVTGRSIRDESGNLMQMFRQFRTMRQARGGRTRV
jgi:hypothetical protein